MTDTEIVAALAEEMREARVGYYTTTAEILLPTVRRIAKQWAAEAVQPLLDLADELDRLVAAYEATDHIGEADTFANGVAAGETTAYEDTSRAIRAAALTATPNHGRSAT